MTLESTCERELTQLVANHLIGDIDRHVLFAVMHSNGQADELGQDHGATGPSLNRLLVLVCHGLFGLGNQVMVDEWTFFQ